MYLYNQISIYLSTSLLSLHWLECWNGQPSLRPSFEELFSELETIYKQSGDDSDDDSDEEDEDEKKNKKSTTDDGNISNRLGSLDLSASEYTVAPPSTSTSGENLSPSAPPVDYWESTALLPPPSSY